MSKTSTVTSEELEAREGRLRMLNAAINMREKELVEGRFGRKHLDKKVASIDHFHYSDFLPNPESILSDRGKGYKVFEDVYANPNVWGLLQRRKNGTLGLEWKLDAEGGDQKIADTLYSVMGESMMRDLMSCILDAVPYGYTPIETMWRLDKGQGIYVPKSFDPKPRDWFLMDKEDNMYFVANGVTDDGKVLCHPHKFLRPRVDATAENPYGTPLLSRVFWNVEFIKAVRKTWMAFLEMFGVPWITAEYRPGQSQEDINDFMKVLEVMRAGGIILTQKGNDTKLMEAGDGSVDMFSRLLEDCRRENALVILGHESSGQSTAGKLGSDSNALEATEDIIQGDMMLVKDTINGFIKTFCEINYPPGIVPPYFDFVVENRVKKDVIERDKIAYDMGLRLTKKYYQDIFGYAEDHIEGMVEAGGGQPAGDNAKKPQGPEAVMGLRVFGMDANSDLEESFEDFMLDRWDDTHLAGGFAAINSYIKGKSEYRAALGGADGLFGSIDTEAIREELTRGAVIAWLMGENASQIETDDEKGFESAWDSGFDMSADISESDFKKLIKLKPEEIAEWFSKKGLSLSPDWKKTVELIQKNMFTVSGVMRMDILTDLKDLLQKNLEEGLSYSEFKKDFKDRFGEKTWRSSEDEKGNTLPPSRIALIYTQNTINAYHAGRWKRFEATMGTHPYVQTLSAKDDRVTKACKKLDKKVFRKDDDYYLKYLRAPGHFRCRRRERPISPARLKVRGLTVSKGSDFSDYKNDKGFIREDDSYAVAPEKKKYSDTLWQRFKRYLKNGGAN